MFNNLSKFPSESDAVVLAKSLTKILAFSTFGVVTYVTLTTSKVQAFSFQDDPNSGFSGNSVTANIDTVNNTRTIHNLIAGNFSNNPSHIYFYSPWFWPKTSNGSYVNMEWRNDLGGWYTSGFDDTTLLVKISNFFLGGASINDPKVQMSVGNLQFDEVADVTGQLPLPSTQPCALTPQQNSPSCYPSDPSAPLQTIDGAAQPPLLDLGIFAPNSRKYFDIETSFIFGDSRRIPDYFNTEDPRPDQFVSFTTVRTITVPESRSVFGLLALGILGVISNLKCQLKTFKSTRNEQHK